MNDNPISYIPIVSSAVGIAAAIATFAARIGRAREQRAHRRWTELQEARLQAGGIRFRLQVFREDKASLEWAVAEGRLRVIEKKSWGWNVVAETHLKPKAPEA